MLSLGFRGGSGISGLGCKVHGVGVKGSTKPSSSLSCGAVQRIISKGPQHAQ